MPISLSRSQDAPAVIDGACKILRELAERNRGVPCEIKGEFDNAPPGCRAAKIAITFEILLLPPGRPALPGGPTVAENC